MMHEDSDAGRSATVTVVHKAAAKIQDTRMMTQIRTAAATRPATSPSTRIGRQAGAGSYLTIVERRYCREFHLTLTSQPGETATALAVRLGETLKCHRADVVQQIVFGPVSVHAELLAAMRLNLGAVDWPVTWVEGGSCTGQGVAGTQVFAVAGAPVETLLHYDQPMGRIFDDGQAQHCILGNLGPADSGGSPTVQAHETFANLEAALAVAGMDLKHVARTWFFLDDILSWYEPFNRVRNEIFSKNELRPASFPASTGVGGKNPGRAALTLGAWAAQPHHPAFRVQTVPSPAQCPAPAYGSAFSRAVEIVSSDCRRLLISGTASIAPDGRTAHIGDSRRQIELTMEVVNAILQSRGLTLADTTRATAYFRSAGDVPLFTAWCARYECDSLPVVSACCDICRDDLLFEIELDALTA